MDAEIRKPLVVGNWKMHATVSEAIKLITALKNLLAEVQSVDIAVAPSMTALYSVSIALAETNIALAGQNLFWEEEGPFTGEVSGDQLKDAGCDFVLIGHSERRQWFQESDEQVNLKVQAALKSDLIPILCVGENGAQREKNLTLEVIEKQLKVGLQDIAIHDFEKMVIAYEPVWAIGTGKVASPEQAEEVHHFIRHWLKRYFDAPIANTIRLLYGGSVKPENASELMKQANVDGLLVGGASLDPESFAKIVQFEERMN